MGRRLFWVRATTGLVLAYFILGLVACETRRGVAMQGEHGDNVTRLRKDLCSERVDARYRAMRFIKDQGGPAGDGGAMHGVYYTWYAADYNEYCGRAERWMLGPGTTSVGAYSEFCMRWSPVYHQ